MTGTVKIQAGGHERTQVSRAQWHSASWRAAKDMVRTREPLVVGDARAEVAARNTHLIELDVRRHHRLSGT
jgi:hypothetical protein